MPWMQSATRPLLSRLIGLWCLAVVLGAGTGVGPLQAQPTGQDAPAPGLELVRLAHDGRDRTYYLRLPGGMVPTPQAPVYLFLHGGGKSDGGRVAFRTGLPDLADREGFIAVFPNGVEARWNDGRGVTFRGGATGTSVDDVGFIAKVIDDVTGRFNGDPQRVLVAGASNGGMMTFRLGCELADKLAAIAPIIANIPEPILAACKPARPVPVLLSNGTLDPWMPYEGGPVQVFGRRVGRVVSTADSLAFWRRTNGCSEQKETEALADRDPQDMSRVHLIHWWDCRSGASVHHYRIEGGGHSIPGRQGRAPRFLGPVNRDIDLPAAIWTFFQAVTDSH